MILVDDQSGSNALYPYIAKITNEVIMTRIDPPFGDIVWAAEGPDNQILNIAVEYKRLSDVLDCMVSGRFTGHQLPGLIANYQRVHLLIEMGRTRIDRDTGVMQQLKDDGRWWTVTRKGQGFTSRELHHWIQTLEEHAGIRVHSTYDKSESARWVVNRHSWWTYKGWDEHTSLKQFHVQTPQFAQIVKPGIVRRVAKELSGLGWERSEAAAKKFKSVREMINANEKTWREVEGVGPTIASRIVKEVTEG